MKKKPLSIQQHLWLSSELHEIREFLQNLYISTAKHYPLKSSAVRQSLKVYQAACDLISDLDNCLFRDNPDISTEAAGVYYPGKDRAFDEAKAKEFAADLVAEAKIGGFLDQRNEAIQQTLFEAFKKYNAETVRQGYCLYFSQTIIEAGACNRGQ